MGKRKYALIKVGQGYYVCPSNDMKTLWRFYSYQEDGSLYRHNAITGKHATRPTLGTFWRAEYTPMPTNLDLTDDELMDMHWVCYADICKTRKEAIESMETAQE